jgi:hypothetical protein
MSRHIEADTNKNLLNKNGTYCNMFFKRDNFADLVTGYKDL